MGVHKHHSPGGRGGGAEKRGRCGRRGSGTAVYGPCVRVRRAGGGWKRVGVAVGGAPKACAGGRQEAIGKLGLLQHFCAWSAGGSTEQPHPQAGGSAAARLLLLAPSSSHACVSPCHRPNAKQPPLSPPALPRTSLVEEPTVMPDGADAGLYVHASPPLLLPAAMTTLMPACTAGRGAAEQAEREVLRAGGRAGGSAGGEGERGRASLLFRARPACNTSRCRLLRPMPPTSVRHTHTQLTPPRPPRWHLPSPALPLHPPPHP